MGATRAAEDKLVRFHAMANYLNSATGTLGSEKTNGALERVEGVRFAV
jgi:hypothetical protein